jgi:prepilin-type N-terminal cleavage/methylation domain-containing protein
MRTRGFSLIELLVVIAIILVIMGMAIPAFRQAHMQALETGAKRAIQVVHTAQFQHQTQQGRFATDLAELGARKLLPSDLAAGQKSGYKYRMTGTEAGYVINASPVTFGTTGSHTYYSDETMVLRENDTSDPATAESPEAGR